jgi:alpha-ketoglutarate-dependent taurine dioxygenase
MRFSEFRSAARSTTAPASEEVTLVSAPGSPPAIAVPTSPAVRLASWIAANAATLRTWLNDHAAVLFRGFQIDDAAGVNACVQAWAGEPMDYRENTSPRAIVYGRIRTSTEYPADQRIVLHNEHSYSMVFPLRLFFYCVRPAETGGETPLADTRGVYARLSPALRDRFRRREWLYVRNFVDGFGESWQTVYQVNDRDALERYLRSASIDWQWTPSGSLRTRIRRPAAVRHPETGDTVWFNHILFWHRSSLDPSLQALLRREYGGDLPHDTFYGDGAPIEQNAIDELRDAYAAKSRTFAWTAGDLLVVDNMLAAHGRMPFTGPRRILFAMAEPTRRGRVAADEGDA